MINGEEKSKRINVGAFLGIGLFVFSLAFRLCGIGWGLKNDLHNASYHPDEPIIFGLSRSIQPEIGQFVPQVTPPFFYSYGTLYLTLLRVASDMTSAYSGSPNVKGDGFSWNHPDRTDWAWVSRCDFAGRLISAIAGAGTVLFVFLMLKRSVGLVAASCAGLLYSIAPGHVIHSRFQTVDVLATFFLVVSLYYASQILLVSLDEVTAARPSATRLAVLAGVFAGLSAGTKYTGILAVLSVFVALYLFEPKKAPLRSLYALLAALAVFCVTTPGILLDTSNFISGVEYELAHTATGSGLVFTGTPNGFLYSFLNLVFGIGPLLAVLGIVGLGYAAYRKHRWSWVLLAFCLPYYALISRAEVKFLRYSFPLYVGVAAGFGYLIQVSHRRGGIARLGVGVGILGLGGVPFGGLAGAVVMTKGMMGEDVRDQAASYLKTQGGTIGYPNTPWFWSAPAFPDSADPLAVSTSTKLALSDGKIPKVVVALDDSQNVSAWNQTLITQLAPSLITYSSFESYPIERLMNRRDLGVQQGEVDSASGFLKKLAKTYVEDRQFGSPLVGGDYPFMLPEDLFYTDPVIFVWKKKS